MLSVVNVDGLVDVEEDDDVPLVMLCWLYELREECRCDPNRPL